MIYLQGTNDLAMIYFIYLPGANDFAMIYLPDINDLSARNQWFIC